MLLFFWINGTMHCRRKQTGKDRNGAFNDVYKNSNSGANHHVKYTIGLLAVYTAEPVSNKSLACGSYFKVEFVLFKI